MSKIKPTVLSIYWMRKIQTDENLKKNMLICLRMSVVLARFFSFKKKRPITMDFLCLLSDGFTVAQATEFRKSETKKIKCRNIEDANLVDQNLRNRKKRRERAGNAIKKLEDNGYIEVDRFSGKRNKIKLIKKK